MGQARHLLSLLVLVGVALGPLLQWTGPADVAQLVEHFTRNEGVPGSNPGVGFPATPGSGSEIEAIR